MAVAAGVVGAAHQTAILTIFRVAAERRSSARCDGAHDPALGAAEMLGMPLAVGFAMAAEDLRYLQPGRHDGGSGWLSDLQLEAGRAGFACCRSWWSRPGRNASWSTDRCGRAAPGWCGCRCRLRANAWRSCAAACASLPACQTRPRHAPLGRRAAAPWDLATGLGCGPGTTHDRAFLLASSRPTRR